MGFLGELLRTRSAEAAVQASGRTAATIELGEMARAQDPLPELPYQDAVAKFLGSLLARFTGPLETSSGAEGRLIAEVKLHPFVEAVHRAFQDHRPLVLSPDSIWLLIAQGFASHVNANPEALRPLLVKHTQRLDLRVRRDDFVRGSPSNPWVEVFEAFSSHIRDHLGADTHDLLLPSFSTTTVDTMAAAQIVLMDAVKSYFNLALVTLCGIPEIILEGTVQDWQLLASRTRSLGKFDLHWWTRVLMPVLDEFVSAARGQANVAFWRRMYKREEEASGGPYIDGWVNVFFPYLLGDELFGLGETIERNPLLCQQGMSDVRLWFEDDRDVFQTAATNRLPTGLARCPFTWNYYGEPLTMEFVGGFVGVRQCTESLRLRPEIGWAVSAARVNVGLNGRVPPM